MAARLRDVRRVRAERDAARLRLVALRGTVRAQRAAALQQSEQEILPFSLALDPVDAAGAAAVRPALRRTPGARRCPRSRAASLSARAAAGRPLADRLPVRRLSRSPGGLPDRGAVRIARPQPLRGVRLFLSAPTTAAPMRRAAEAGVRPLRRHLRRCLSRRRAPSASARRRRHPGRPEGLHLMRRAPRSSRCGRRRCRSTISAIPARWARPASTTSSPTASSRRRDMRRIYSEQLVYLPHCYQVERPPARRSPPTPDRAATAGCRSRASCSAASTTPTRSCRRCSRCGCGILAGACRAACCGC